MAVRAAPTVGVTHLHVGSCRYDARVAGVIVAIRPPRAMSRFSAELTGKSRPPSDAVTEIEPKLAQVADLGPSYLAGNYLQNDAGKMDENHQLVSRATLAKLARCSKANVTQQCRKTLAPACVGQDVNLAHPAAASFLRRHGISREYAADAAATQPARALSLIPPELLRLELGQVLGLHDARYRPGETVRLGRLLRALRRMNAGARR